VFDSLRGLCDAGLALLQNRVELFAVEFEEAKARLFRTLLLIGVVAFLAVVAIVIATIAIVFLSSESARPAVLVSLTVFYALAALGGWAALRRHLHSAPPPFRETIGELKKDRDWLSPRK
jgi:uncharacterized membrane protein YqjE